MMRRIVHEIVGGFCIQCDDTAEWLISRGEEVSGYTPCRSAYLAGFSTAIDCTREAGHDGSHRSFAGSVWD